MSRVVRIAVPGLPHYGCERGERGARYLMWMNGGFSVRPNVKRAGR